MTPYGERRWAALTTGAPALDVRELTVAYGGRVALRDVSFRLPAGAQVALIGHNGAGKSTLLKAIIGLVETPGDAIQVYGQPVRAHRSRVAYLPQRSAIDWRFPVDVGTLVMAGRYVHMGWRKRPDASDRKLVRDALACCGMTGLADEQIGRLSGGQQQRALLARALAQQADLLLLDEPYSALDAASRAALEEVLDDQQRAGRTLLLATHDLEATRDRFDAVLELHEGRLTSSSQRTVLATQQPVAPAVAL